MFNYHFFVSFAVAIAVSSTANAATFNVVLDTDTVDGSGSITIDDSLISANAEVNYLDPLVSVALSFDGLVYDTPFDASPVGGDTVFIFDGLGQEIIAVDDKTPEGSRFTDFRVASDISRVLGFDDGPVPGTFVTFELTSPDEGELGLTGNFSIERTSVAPIPLPASALLLLGGLAGLAGFAARREPEEPKL